MSSMRSRWCSRLRTRGRRGDAARDDAVDGLGAGSFSWPHRRIIRIPYGGSVLRPAALVDRDRGDVVSHVLDDAEPCDAVEPGLVVGHGL